jgi:hypothetical protein
MQVQFGQNMHWYRWDELVLVSSASASGVPDAGTQSGQLRFSLLNGFDLSLLKKGLSHLASLLDLKEPTLQSKISHFPRDMLAEVNPQIINFFVRDRVGGICNDPSGPPHLAEAIQRDWETRGQLIFDSDQMRHFQKHECHAEVQQVVVKLQELAIGSSSTSNAELSTEMVTEKEVELEVQAVKEVVRMHPSPANAIKSWELNWLNPRHIQRLPFFSASELSFHDITLPFPERVSVSSNFCSKKPEGAMSVAQFALNWSDGSCTRTTVLSLAEAAAVRRAAQLQLHQPANLGMSSYEIIRITQCCKSRLTAENIIDWKRRLSCCRLIQGDIWMTWPDDFFLLQAFESSSTPCFESASPERREQWFMQCLLSQVCTKSC